MISWFGYKTRSTPFISSRSKPDTASSTSRRLWTRFVRRGFLLLDDDKEPDGAEMERPGVEGATAAAAWSTTTVVAAVAGTGAADTEVEADTRGAAAVLLNEAEVVNSTSKKSSVGETHAGATR